MRPGRSAVLLIAALWLGMAPHRPSSATPPPSGEDLYGAYLGILQDDPYQDYALRRLLEVSGDRGGTDGLVLHLEGLLESRPSDSALWLVLGHVHRETRQGKRALEAYERAAALLKDHPGPRVAMARVHRQARAWSEALAHFDGAVERVGRDRQARQEILHEALVTALESGQMAKAEGYSTAYVATRPDHMPTRMDLAATLTRSGHHEMALKAWEEARTRARGQLRFLASIWPEMARLHEQAGRLEAAEALWREALSKLPRTHWARPGALEGMIGVYRRRDALRALLEEWSSLKQKRFLETMAVARLYGELGEQEEALASYRQAAELRRGDLESRKKIAELVRQAGSTRSLLKAYEDLERVAPRDPSFPLSRAELAFQRGKRERGTGILKTLLKRFSRDPGVHQRAADLLIRYGGDKAHQLIERCYDRLIRMEPREDAHVVSLGELFWSQGKEKKALSTWRGLLKRRGRYPGRAHLRLAEVLSEHRLMTQAKDHYGMAVAKAPRDLRVLTAEARWLDEHGGKKEALASWTRVLEVASASGEGDLTAAEARTAVIRLWEKQGRLDRELKRLASVTTARPDDLMNGLLLTEALLRQRRWGEAEAFLLKIREAAPRRLDVLRALETLYTRSNRHKKALAVLDDIAEREDTYSPEILGRAARLALRTGDKERALKLALRLARESSGGASARIEAGDLLTELGHLEEASRAWASALVITPRDGDLRFRLAALYQRLDRPDDEEQLLTTLVRESLDPAHVLRAGKRLIQLAVSRDRLEPLERVLMPLVAYGGRRREVHLRLLVNVYGAMTQGLRWSPDARDHLRRLGERALNPLLQALDIRDASLRSQALDVLELTRTPGAVPTLSRLLSEADAGTRLRAASILGSLGTDSSVNALTRFAKRNAGSVRQMTIWALGLSRSEAAEDGLLALEGLEPADRQIWVLALGMQRGVRSGPALRARLKQSVGSEHLACIWALARQGHPESREALISVLDRGHQTAVSASRTRIAGTTTGWMHMAAWGLGRIGDDDARQALLDRLWDPGPGRRHRAVTIGLFTAPQSPESRPEVETLARYRALMDPKSWKVTPNAARLATLIPTVAAMPREPAAQELRIKEVQGAVNRLLEEGRPGRVARFLSGVVTPGIGLTLPELLPQELTPAVSSKIIEILRPHRDRLYLWARSPSPELAAASLGVLGYVEGAGPRSRELTAAVSRALTGTQPQVQSAGLRALAGQELSSEEAEAALSLIRRVDSLSPPVKISLLGLGSTLPGAVTGELLTRLSFDPDPNIRLQVARTASHLCRPEFADLLRELSMDRNAMVADAALEGVLCSRRAEGSPLFDEISGQIL